MLAQPILAVVFATLIALPASADLRSTELVRLECASDLGRMDTVLFANGTVRRRVQGEEKIALGEMTTDEVDRYVARLEEFDLRRVHTRYRRSVSGDWVDVCQLALDLDGSGPILPQYFTFGPYDALPSPLGSVLDVVRELDAKVAPFSTERLPNDYEGRPGDVLRDEAGAEYRIIGLTGDRAGFEIQRLDQPMTFFVRREDLRARFVEVVSRRGGA